MKKLFDLKLIDRAIACVVVSAALVLGIFGIAMLMSLAEWRTKTAEWNDWITGQGPQCTRIFAEAHEAARMVNGGNLCPLSSGPHDMDAMLECQKRVRDRVREIAAELQASGCPIHGGFTQYSGLYGEPGLPILASPRPTGTLHQYVLGKYEVPHKAIAPIIGILAFGLFLAIDVAKRIALGTSAGWRRLLLVLALAAAGVTAVQASSSGNDLGESLFRAAGGMAITLMALTYGRTVYMWVSSGFDKPQGDLPKDG